MKKGAMLKKKYELILFEIIFLSVLIGFVIADNNTHKVMTTAGATSWIIKEDQSFAFNITINNSFPDNITLVNITIPSTFLFKYNTNGTSAALNLGGGAGFFSNITTTTTMLGWANTSTDGSLVYPGTNSTFWFNVTPSEPGIYNIIVATGNSTYTSTRGFVNTTTLTVTVMEIHNVMTIAGTRNFSAINEDTSSLFNITLNNTVPIAYGNITNITITFPSSLIFTAGSNGGDGRISVNSTFTNTSTSITWKNNTNGLVTDTINNSIWFNLTATDPGIYNFTVTTVNYPDNGTHVQNFTVSVRDITNPVPSYSCSKARVSEGEYLSCSCNATDNYDPSPVLVYTAEPSTVNAGTYTITCTATDDATYNASATVTYIVESSGSNVVSGTSGGGTTYTNTYAEDSKEFTVVKEVARELKTNEKIRILFDGAKHNIGVTGLTTSTATIEIFSTVQTNTLSVGDTKRFDLNNDGYYDLSVTLNSITNNKAIIVLRSISEKITTETAAPQEQEKQAATGEQTQPETATLQETSNNAIIWVIVIIIVILILAGIGYGLKKKKRR